MFVDWITFRLDLPTSWINTTDHNKHRLRTRIDHVMRFMESCERMSPALSRPPETAKHEDFVAYANTVQTLATENLKTRTEALGITKTKGST